MSICLGPPIPRREGAKNVDAVRGVGTADKIESLASVRQALKDRICLRVLLCMAGHIAVQVSKDELGRRKRLMSNTSAVSKIVRPQNVFSCLCASTSSDAFSGCWSGICETSFVGHDGAERNSGDIVAAAA